MATDFVQHSAEIKQVAHLVVGTTNTQVSHTGAHFYGPLDLLQVINSYSPTLARLFFSRNSYGQTPAPNRGINSDLTNSHVAIAVSHNFVPPFP
jgi:hypothetical protein